MQVICAMNRHEACRLAAEILADQIRNQPDSVLGLATGWTPLGIYRELVSIVADLDALSELDNGKLS